MLPGSQALQTRAAWPRRADKLRKEGRMSQSVRAKVRIADKWWVTIAVTLGMLMSIMDSTIVNVAIPTLRGVFGADIRDVQWVVTIYMITQAAVIPTAPYLVARFGSKRAYVGTLTAFLLGSVLCGFAWNVPSLVFFRLIQGIGGGILLPMVMILLYQAFPIEERGMASSAMGIPLMAAPLFGPVLGGYLVTAFGWQSAFFINVPLGILAIAIAQKVLPSTQPERQARFDGLGFLTVASGSVALLYSVSAVTSGDTALRNILVGCGAVALLLIFVAVELIKGQRGRAILLDLRRFRDRTFSFSTLALICQTFAVFGILFLIPIYLQTLRHQTALYSGAIQGATALATLVILPIAGRLSDTIGPRPVALLGLIVLAGAAAVMALVTLTTPIVLFVGILILLGCSGGLTGQITVAAMSQIAHEERQAVANASTLVSVLRATAAPLGVAMLSSLVEAQSQQYRISLAQQGIAGDLLTQQSVLLAMHTSFLVAALLALMALLAMCGVPKRRLRALQPPESAPIGEASIS
jgi:EmrB/QacA subfamily drug resistance transporter